MTQPLLRPSGGVPVQAFPARNTPCPVSKSQLQRLRAVLIGRNLLYTSLLHHSLQPTLTARQIIQNP